MGDVERLAEASAGMDHEIQKMVVLLRQAPPEVRAMILDTAEALPDYPTLQESLQQVALSTRTFNQAVERIMRELRATAKEVPQETDGDRNT